MTINLQPAAWGGLRLYVAELRGPLGRSLTVHEPAIGDGYVVQDRGPQLATVELELVWCDVPDEQDDYLARFRAFLRLREEGRAQIFTHPILGSYRASLGRFDVTLRADGEIRAQAEFVPVQRFDPVAAIGAGASPIAGPEAVTAAARRTDEELAVIGVSSPVPAAAIELAEGWTDGAELADARRVHVEIATFQRQVDQEIERLQLTRLRYWQAYREIVGLRAAVRDAAQAVAAEVDQTFDVIVEAAAPLIAICARQVGAAAAPGVARQVARMNDLRSPALVPGGTRLKFPMGSRSSR